LSLDVVLAGGGLANGLIALRLRQLRPELSLAVVEQGPSLGGNHTWSFHTTDLTEAERDWVRPLLSRSWPSHRVVFPRYERSLPGGYHSIRSERFHEVVAGAVDGALRTGTGIAELGPGWVVLDDGSHLEARCVIDGRGWPQPAGVRLGYQKFLGLDLRLAEPHGLGVPILMDASCEQLDGYRFFYVLPWSETELLVEDTTYSDTPDSDLGRLRSAVLGYAEQKGWKVEQVGREETGVLPIPLSGSATAFLDVGPPGLPRSGLRAGLFHLTTSYSLPWAVRLADAIAALPLVDSASVERLVRARATEHWRRGAFFRVLNRMLFCAAQPEQRVRIFQRFYRSSPALIERFYAGRLTLFDRVRILTGRPPVPVLAALRSAFGAI